MRKNEESKGFSQEEKDAMPMKNAAIDKLNSLLREQKIESGYKKVNDAELRNPYSYNDIFGGTVETERFNMPGGGTSMSRTRMNDKGQPVKRVVKNKNIN